MSGPTCTMISCTTDGQLGGFASVLLWWSHVWLAFPALLYTLAVMIAWDGATNVAQLHAVVPALKDAGITTKEKVYEAFEACTDESVKHMSLFLVHFQRVWACYQSAAGAGLWCVIALVPIHRRMPAHFCLAWLQLSAGVMEMSLLWGTPIGVDCAAKFGATKPGATLPEGTEAFPRPNAKQAVSNIYVHWVLGGINVVLGILCFFAPVFAA